MQNPSVLSRPYLEERLRLKALLVFLPFCLMILLVTPSSSESARLSQTQVEKIDKQIQASKTMSDKAFVSMENAQTNTGISKSNLERTLIRTFSEAENLYSDAASKFARARKMFDDAWISMQQGLEQRDLRSVQVGQDTHNHGLAQYNHGIQLLNRASEVFKQAVIESNTAKDSKAAGQSQSGNQKGRAASSPWLPSMGDSKSFPGAALAILVITLVTSLQGFKDPRIIEEFILHPWSIANHHGRYRTLLTCGLIHANPMHLTMNIVSFCFFGFQLENIIGHWQFLTVYFGSLVFSSFVLTAKNRNHAYYKALGASGAITGVIFAYILYRPHSKISFMFAPMGIPAPVFALVYTGYSYYMARHKFDNVAHDAHLWGGISGFLIALTINPDVVRLLQRHMLL